MHKARLSIESLEARSLLSGLHSVVPSPIINYTAAHVSTKTAAAAATNQHTETHLTATLADPSGISTVTGSAEYEAETEKGIAVKQLNVQIKGGTPGAILDVTISDSTGNKVAVGQMTVKTDGSAQLNLSANLPDVVANSVITLSTTDATGATTVLSSGLFAAPSTKSDGSHSEQNDTHLKASIIDPNSTLTGSAYFESETEHGLVVSQLKVKLKGGVPGTVIDVSIAADSKSAASSVGQITIGADGSGQLKLSKGAPGITATSVITLSTVTTAADGTIMLTPITSANFA